MQWLLLLLVVFSFHSVKGQELYVFTEPASNMAAKSFGSRANNYLMKKTGTKQINYHLVPEVMWGASKQTMIHVEAFLSNRNNKFVAEGGGVYVKYRFHSEDDVHSHFRMAVYGRHSFNNSNIHQQAIDLNGHNSGYETGLVATQLRNKVVVSASASYLYATDNMKEKFIYGSRNRNAFNYTLSEGRLMLPKEYTSYKQTNINLMVEILGQANLNKGYSFLDSAPSVHLFS